MDTTQIARDIAHDLRMMVAERAPEWRSDWGWSRTPDGAAWQATRILGQWPAFFGMQMPGAYHMCAVNVRVPRRDIGLVQAVIAEAITAIEEDGVSDSDGAAGVLRPIRWAGSKMYLLTHDVRHGDDLCRIAVLRMQ